MGGYIKVSWGLKWMVSKRYDPTLTTYQSVRKPNSRGVSILIKDRISDKIRIPGHITSSISFTRHWRTTSWLTDWVKLRNYNPLSSLSSPHLSLSLCPFLGPSLSLFFPFLPSSYSFLLISKSLLSWLLIMFKVEPKHNKMFRVITKLYYNRNAINFQPILYFVLRILTRIGDHCI